MIEIIAKCDDCGEEFVDDYQDAATVPQLKSQLKSAGWQCGQQDEVRCPDCAEAKEKK